MDGEIIGVEDYSGDRSRERQGWGGNHPKQTMDENFTIQVVTLYAKNKF